MSYVVRTYHPNAAAIRSYILRLSEADEVDMDEMRESVQAADGWTW